MRLTPRQQVLVAEGVKRGDVRATERLLEAFKPLMSRMLANLAYSYRGTPDHEDLAAEMVEWIIQLTKKWDRSIRNLDGFLKQWLTYKTKDWVKRKAREREGASQQDESKGEAMEAPSSRAYQAIEELEDTAAERGSYSVEDAVIARGILEDIRARLTDPYLRQIFELKLLDWTNADIGEAIGVTAKKVRNDWSRRVLPIAYCVLEEHGISVPGGRKR